LHSSAKSPKFLAKCTGDVVTVKTTAEETQGGLSESAGAAFAQDAASAKAGASAARDMTAGLIMAMIVSQSLGDRILIDTAVRDGLKMKVALELDRKGDVNMDSVTRHNIIPRKTWDSALKSGADTLTPVNSERLLRVARVTAKARETFGRERADIWMERATTALGGQPPMALLATEAGAGAVELLLTRIDHGFAA
jgi:putative toxin-antitoxin system antitoxin component (TIGR02293 family)